MLPLPSLLRHHAPRKSSAAASVRALSFHQLTQVDIPNLVVSSIKIYCRKRCPASPEGRAYVAAHDSLQQSRSAACVISTAKPWLYPRYILRVLFSSRVCADAGYRRNFVGLRWQAIYRCTNSNRQPTFRDSARNTISDMVLSGV